MSRVGKMPIALPSGAEATISAEQITVKGPLGALTQASTAWSKWKRPTAY